MDLGFLMRAPMRCRTLPLVIVFGCEGCHRRARVLVKFVDIADQSAQRSSAMRRFILPYQGCDHAQLTDAYRHRRSKQQDMPDSRLNHPSGHHRD